VAGAYWKGPTSVQAWSLTLISLVLVIGNVVVQYGINLWNRSFFNALQQRDQSFVYQAIAIFLALAFAAAVVAVLQLVFRMRLQILWRRWLMRRLVGQWLSEQRFYRLSIAAPDLDAPEFRIAEDAKVATEPVVDFGYGITNAVLTAAVFFGVLWSASGSADFFGWRIPGFMVYAAVVYSIVLSGSMVLFGRASPWWAARMTRDRPGRHDAACDGRLDQGCLQPGLADMAHGGQRRDGPGSATTARSAELPERRDHAWRAHAIRSSLRSGPSSAELAGR